MLRTLLQLQQPFYIARQEKAPLLREREAFLEHLLQPGHKPCGSAHVSSWQLLNVIRLLKLTQLRDVWIDEIEEAAKKWTRQQRSNPNIRSCKHTGSYFIYVAKKWLRFAGVLKLPATPRMRFADKIDELCEVDDGRNGAVDADSSIAPERKARCFSSGFPHGAVHSLPCGSEM